MIGLFRMYTPTWLAIFCMTLMGILTLPNAMAHETPVASLDIREGRNGVQWLEWTYYVH
jgi:hypothetical protein